MAEYIDLPNLVPVPHNIQEQQNPNVIAHLPHVEQIQPQIADQEEDEGDNLVNMRENDARLEPEPQPIYLNPYFDMLYFFGLCPFDGTGTYPKSLYGLILFVLFTTLAVLQHVVVIKRYLVFALEKENLFDSLLLAYFIFLLIKSTYFCLFLGRSEVPSLLKNLHTNVASRARKQKAIFYATSFILICTGIFSAMVRCASLDDYSEGEPFIENIILDNAGDLSVTIYQWNFTNAEKGAKEIKLTHAANITRTSLCFGILQYWSYTDFWFQRYIMNDILLILSFSLFCVAKVCKKFIVSTVELNNDSIRRIWRAYMFVHLMSTKINQCFGVLIILQHVDNWFQCSYFLYNIYQGNFEWYSGSITISRILLTFLAYGFAYSISKLESQTEYHLHVIAQQTIDDPDAHHLREYITFVDGNLKVFPPGIGTGSFRISGAFLLKFSGSVLSCFLLLADTLSFSQLAESIKSSFKALFEILKQKRDNA